MYESVMKGGFATNTMSIHDHAKQYDNKLSSNVYDDDGSCMTIYLGIVMSMA